MVKRIFVDANIMIDLLNENNELGGPTVTLLNTLVQQRQVLLCSPVTFAITYYFFGKQLKNNKLLNEKVKRLFKPFLFTADSAAMMERVLQSSFEDLEDALQYYSALDAKADIILTKNYFDFYQSSIPVYHPLHYMSEFLL